MAGGVTYLLEAQEGFGSRSPVFHVLFGGQQKPLPAGFEGGGAQLRVTTRRVTIPMSGGGRFVQQPPYPRGGIHGDHAIVMWNENGHGYLVSAHSETSFRAATSTAIRIARSSRPNPG